MRTDYQESLLLATLLIHSVKQWLISELGNSRIVLPKRLILTALYEYRYYLPSLLSNLSVL